MFHCFSPDAFSCSMANCQYGCDVLKGEVRCRCPSPGLQLGPDGRTCIGRWSNVDVIFLFRMFLSVHEMQFERVSQMYLECIMSAV